MECFLRGHKKTHKHGKTKYLCPPKSEAVLYHNVGPWLDRTWRSNFVLASVKGAKEPWAVITEEDPTLQTLWQYTLTAECQVDYQKKPELYS